MISFLLLITGIILAILKSNNILIIDQWIIYLTFGCSLGLFILQLINARSVNRQIKNQFNKFKF